MHIFSALISGLLFGLGLAVSQMVDPGKVLDFLDFSGNWDPSLALVMLGALIVSFPTFRWIRNSNKPIFASDFKLPVTKMVDKRLVIGAGLFGVGWGMTGYCPGPAIAASGLGYTDSLITVIAIILGFCAYQIWTRFT